MRDAVVHFGIGAEDDVPTGGPSRATGRLGGDGSPGSARPRHSRARNRNGNRAGRAVSAVPASLR